MGNILCIDDTPHVLEELVDILEMEGYDTVEANNALDALELIFTETPDLIITDIQMTTMDGLALVEKICSLERFKHIPVIVLSARADAISIESAKGLGIKEYLKKPCSADLLIETVKNQLELEDTQNFTC